MCPSLVALACEKPTVSKSVSAVSRQVFSLEQIDGASAIHSAEEVSGAAMRRTRAKLVPRVRSRSLTVTLLPLT